MRGSLSLGVLLVLGACEKKDPLYCDAQTPCTDPDRPFCDLEGEYPASDGIKRTCIADPFGDAGVCTAGEPIGCLDGDTAIVCGDDGRGEVTVECRLGCDERFGACACEPGTTSCDGDTLTQCGPDGVPTNSACVLGCNADEPRCNLLDPSNALSEFLDGAADAPPLVLTGAATINTTTGAIKNGDGQSVPFTSLTLPAPDGGVPVRVFTASSIDVEELTVNGAPALVLVSAGDVVIRGMARVSAGKTTGDLPCNGSVGEQVDPGSPGGADEHAGGDGGGGFGGPGGPGGDTPLAMGGPGGAMAGNAELEPLRGGCAGGGGSAGGGAIQIVSATRIWLAGEESRQGHIYVGGTGGLLGGGSGGGILLEAPEVELSAGSGASANGGGGGCSNSSGEDGTTTMTPAAGDRICTQPNGDGGDGGAGDEPAEPGQNAEDSGGGRHRGGGGGGGVGRIRINTRDASFDPPPGAILSPVPTVGAVKVR